jgi:D-serine deaminase-like pyridoxal phosphate-dependent protein
LFGVDSPALLVFPEFIEENIKQALAIAKTDQGNCLRLHVKTVKCKEPILMAVKQGVNKFKCSTISEAEMLGGVGVSDVLINYQLSSVKAARYKKIIEKYPETIFSCLVDNVESAKLIADIFIDNPIRVYIDINLGLNRTGISVASALKLFESIILLKGIIVVGLHGYEGHISSSDYDLRKSLAEEAYFKMDGLRVKAQKFIKYQLNIVMGGSPTFSFYAGKDNVDSSPGTVFLWDAGYGRLYPELPFRVAAILLTRVISIIDKNILCLDLGYKAVASDPPLPRVEFTNISSYTILGQYEEHMVVQVPDTSNHRVGEQWYAIPIHICPTVNLYEKLVVLKNGKLKKPWQVVARDRKIKI